MSQREFLIVLAHAHLCTVCRDQLLNRPAAVLVGHRLTAAEKETLEALKFEDFLTPEALAHAAGVSVADLSAYCDEAVVRLRHL